MEIIQDSQEWNWEADYQLRGSGGQDVRSSSGEGGGHRQYLKKGRTWGRMLS